MDIPHRAYVVYLYLLDRANKDGECWPSVNKIAGDTKMSPATVRRAIKDLRKANLIETKQRYRDKGGKSSLLFRINHH
jgi:DNA-binding transcriptional regulator YhcF (GntR family)